MLKRKEDFNMMNIQQKTAILIISFGTSYQNAIENNIGITEKEIQKYYKNYTVFRAFTSKIILNQLKKEGIEIDTIVQAVEKIIKQDYTSIICQPTYIMHGREYQKMILQLQPYKQKINILYGKPLLSDESDYQKVVNCMISENQFITKKDALILIGHGSKHGINSCYRTLEYYFAKQGYDYIFVATVEDSHDIDIVLNKLQKKSLNTIYILPFMIVIGFHAHQNIFGQYKNTWKNQMEHRGYCIKPIVRGLGEYQGICRIFIEHIENAIKSN